MANKTLSDARKNKDDEFYTRLEDISEELNNYKKHFKDKIVLCNCDDPEWSNFWIFLHQNFSEFGIKKLISTHYNADGSSSYVMEYTGGNDVDPKDWHQRSLKGNGDFASEECIELLKSVDLITTNPPFSLFRKYVELLMKHNKKFLIIGNKNAITYKEFFSLLKNNEVWEGYNMVKEFIKPDGSVQKFGNIGWFTNLDIPKRHIKLIPSLKYEFNNHPELYQKYDNYNAINVDKVTDIPYDYIDIMGVPITYVDRHNPDEFEIIGITNHGDMAGIPFINNCFAEVNGKRKYVRVFIRRKMKRGEREAKTILEKMGILFNPCYYDNAENDNNPDFQYQDGRYLEITHTKHNFGNIDHPNKYYLLPTEKQIEISEKAAKAYDRLFSGDYPFDSNGIITEEGKKMRDRDWKIANKHYGLDEEHFEKGNVCSRCFTYENIFDAIETKEEKHADKDLDVFVFAHDYEIEIFINCLNNNKKMMFCRLNKTHFKNIFICSFKFDENKYDTDNYTLININNINNTFEICHEGTINEN